MANRPTIKPVALPTKWSWLFNGFRRYVVRFVRKNFHTVRISKTSAPWPQLDVPIVVVLNHPAWWDPMISTVLSLEFPSNEQYAAIDAIAVQKYPVLTKIGFFPVDTQSLRGAAEFLKLAMSLLSQPGRIVWITAQGRFMDARARPLDLRSGVGHLAARMEHGLILPIALEYSFWNERTPEALVRVGQPINVTEARDRSAKEWTERIEAALTDTLDKLNAEVMARDPELFKVLLGGRVGVGGMYDLWRRLTSWARGKKFNAAHDSEQPEPPAPVAKGTT